LRTSGEEDDRPPVGSGGNRRPLRIGLGERAHLKTPRRPVRPRCRRRPREGRARGRPPASSPHPHFVRALEGPKATSSPRCCRARNEPGSGRRLDRAGRGLVRPFIAMSGFVERCARPDRMARALAVR
jgi:hypothetical protein